ncbi:hypothetical protein BDV11DRAFT_187122 [Aspergillus similis]
MLKLRLPGAGGAIAGGAVFQVYSRPETGKLAIVLGVVLGVCTGCRLVIWLPVDAL